MRYFVIILLAQMLSSDPFYYGDRELKKELKLYGILHTKANINGQWVGLNASFTHTNSVLENVNFKLIELQNSCVVVENMESKMRQKLCKDKPKFIKEGRQK
ncbi:hypothetical protein [Helicobacter sp.]|uniref:hypothetical protein n=1 Tax=Helicobacter sp. TaxID=218 RepID=UPI0025BDA903|nr:hypothetical protein [Helicobacter sp.]MCI5968366.1 hypothetical protein [Helicobacter sp.]MDY2584825.1 hypothetical protein [Helicobacter sp.]